MSRERKMRTAMAGALLAIIGLAIGLGGIVGCEHSTGDSHRAGAALSSRAYKGHSADADINNFVAAYPMVWGSRLDDCQTCHWGLTVRDNKAKVIASNPCVYCHYINHPPAGYTNLPTSVGQTLNPYGARYLAAGQNVAALNNIAHEDSDGDGFDNAAEIWDGRYPGNPNSYPGLALCPVKTVTMAELQAMPQHTQFTLANAERQQYDNYATYTGVRIKDILTAKGIPTATATNIDILAPDGFKNTNPITMDQVNLQFPAHQFFAGLGQPNYDATCAFVEYPADTHGYASGDYITDAQWHIIAYLREGLPLDPCYLDPVSGKINGEGPFRNVMPPGKSDPLLNQPDRGSKVAAGCPDASWNYNINKDHNAGQMVKGAVIIKLLPMPTGCEEFDLVNGGFALIDAEELLIYGHSVE
jgi:hypothetical protein